MRMLSKKLVAEDIMEKVEHSEWASPTVPVIKPNDDLRICGDYSVTINKFSDLEQYPVPTLEELLNNLSGGNRFTKIDLSQAFLPGNGKNPNRMLLGTLKLLCVLIRYIGSCCLRIQSLEQCGTNFLPNSTRDLSNRF